MAVDFPVLIAGVLRATDAGRHPKPAVRELLIALSDALGAAGAAFATPGEGAARIVAASPGAAWSLGRTVAADSATDPPAVAEGRPAGLLRLYLHPDRRLDRDAQDAVRLVARLLGVVRPPATDPLVAALADGLAVVAADGTVRSWNPAAQVITGRTAAQAVGHPIPFAVPPPGRTVELDLADARVLSVSCTALAGSADHVVTFRDVTEARRRERAKDLFVATTSHELRTPVTVIRGYVDTLHRRWDQLDDDTRRDLVRAIHERADRLAVLVDRLLLGGDEERVDALLEPREFDLLAALGEAVARLGPEEAARLRPTLPDRLPPAYGDPDSVPTVLTELVQNAHKYSPGGGVITLTAGADDNTVWFEIADSGIGVRPEDTGRVFDRFWQAERTDRRRFGGVGLGLYLVRRIVEGQHGWVSLRRRNPDGTVAEVRLPRAGV
jgi:signal transduction histidine kinase